MMRVVVTAGPGGVWYWRLVARNGETLAHSESYSRRGSARRSARKIAVALAAELID